METINKLEGFAPAQTLLRVSGKAGGMFGATLASFTEQDIQFDGTIALNDADAQEFISILRSYQAEKNAPLFDRQICAVLVSLSLNSLRGKNDTLQELLYQQVIQEQIFAVCHCKSSEVLEFVVAKLSSQLLPFEVFIQKTKPTTFDPINEYIGQQFAVNNYENILKATIYLSRTSIQTNASYVDACIKHAMQILELAEDKQKVPPVHQSLLANCMCGFVACLSVHSFDASDELEREYCNQFITDLYSHSHDFGFNEQTMITFLNCCFEANLKLAQETVYQNVVQMLVSSIENPLYSDYVITAHLTHVRKCVATIDEIENKIVLGILDAVQGNESLLPLLKCFTLFENLDASCKTLATNIAEKNLYTAADPTLSLNILLACSGDDLFTYKFTNIVEKYLFSIEFDHIEQAHLFSSFHSFFSKHPTIYSVLLQHALKSSLEYFGTHPPSNAKKLVAQKLPFLLQSAGNKMEISFEDLEPFIAQCWFFIISFGFDMKKPFAIHSELEPFAKALSPLARIAFSKQFFQDEIYSMYEKYDSTVPSIKVLNAHLASLGIIEPKETSKDVAVIYQDLVMYYSLHWQFQQGHGIATFFHIVEKDEPKLAVLQAALQNVAHRKRGFYCDNMMHFVDEFFIELLKRATSRYASVANTCYECALLVMKKFACCLQQNPLILEFIMTLMSKLHEASTLEWNETFDPTIDLSYKSGNETLPNGQVASLRNVLHGKSFKIDTIDDLEIRSSLYKKMRNIFFTYISGNLTDFCLLSHVYLILKNYNENISSFVKKITLEKLFQAPDNDNRVTVRNVQDDLSFVIKILSFSNSSVNSMASPAIVEEFNENASTNETFDSFVISRLPNNSSNQTSMINTSFISETSSDHSILLTDYNIISNFRHSLVTDPKLTWIHEFIPNGHFQASLSVSILTSQLISYIASINPAAFPELLQSFLNSFFRMKTAELGIFSCPSNEYLFNGKIVAGPSNVDHFKSCFISPSLPFIVILDAVQGCIERLAFKNEKISALAQNICQFFCSSTTSLSNNPLYLPALFRIASFMLMLDSTFNLETLPFIEKFIVSCYDCEVVDCRFSDAKSWSLEKTVLANLLSQLSSFGERARKLLGFLLDFDLYRQRLWHSSSCDYEPFSFEWDFKVCKEMIGVCFTEYGLPRLGMNVYSKILMAANRVPQPRDLLHVLVANANTCPISIKCPFLLIHMVQSKLMSESLIKLVDDWATLSPITLIGLLREDDTLIKQYAIECLKYGYTPQVIFFYIPQLVQLLRRSSCQKDAKEIIFELAQKSRLFSHLIIWNMRANLATDDAGEKLDPILAPTLNDCIERIKSAFSGEHREFYEREFGFFEKVTNISGLLKPFIKSSKIEKKQKIDQELAKIPVDSGVYLPSNPESTVVGIDYHSGRPLQSAAKAPFMATFEILQEDQLVPIRQSAIFKVGDDCRQDVLALQMINMFKMIFDSVGLPLYLYPYRVVATAPGCGVIEVIPEAISRDIMGREYVNDLYEYYLQKFGPQESFEFQQARQRFICSLAAYSIVSYLLSFKDRHNGNIMFDSMGHIIHIDFGFMLGIAPGNTNIEGEGFKLTGEMLRLMGGTNAQSEHFIRFKTLVVNGYVAVRPWMNEFVRIVELMMDSGLPCMRKDTIEKFKMKFRPDLSEFQARKHMLQIIDKSSEYIFATLYDLYQFKKHQIPYKK